MAFKDGELPNKFRGYTSGGLLDQMMPSPDFIEYQRKINKELLKKMSRVPDRAELLAELYQYPKDFSMKVFPSTGVPVFDPARIFLGFDKGTAPDQLNIKVKRKHKLKFNFNN